MACKDAIDCSTARAAYTSYCTAAGRGDDPIQEMAFLAGVAWAMARTDDLVRINREYVTERAVLLEARLKGQEA